VLSARDALLHQAASGSVVLQLIHEHRLLCEPLVIPEEAP
jgi:hypothetical protein